MWRCPEALSIQVNQMVYELKRAGRSVTVLSLGEAFFKIPMFEFAALDFERGYHYSDSQGIPSLREKIAGFYRTHLRRDCGWRFGSPDHCRFEGRYLSQHARRA